MKQDVQIYDLIRKEEERQTNGIELIASENFVSKDVLNALGSVCTNKYAEGYPEHRYYGGCQIVDQIEQLAIDRLCKLYDAEYANVQPHSGAQANTAIYLACLQPGDTFMTLLHNICNDYAQESEVTDPQTGATTLTVIKTDVLPLAPDPKGQVDWYDCGPMLLVSSTPKWEAKSQWFYQVNEDYGSFKPYAPARKKVNEIIKGKKTDMFVVEDTSAQSSTDGSNVITCSTSLPSSS